MAKQPMGKMLLRNVIRHTHAHNKIQEEMEMWKMRDSEVQMSHHKDLSDPARGHMRCDRVSDHEVYLDQGRARMSEHDDREARYWTRKLYDFEAKDPDRWGHSGFKELYPEEFESDGEKSRATKKTGHRKLKKSKSDTEACLSKRPKKASRKKKKKKKKKGEEEKRRRAASSSSDCSSDCSSAIKDKPRRKRTKSRHKNKKTKSRGRDGDGSSGDSDDDEADADRRTHGRKKRKHGSHRDSDSGPNAKKRKDGKATGEGSSDESSAD